MEDKTSHYQYPLPDCFIPLVVHTNDFLADGLTYEQASMVLQMVVARLGKLTADSWKADCIRAMVDKIVQETSLSRRQVWGVLRVAITGKKISLPLAESIELLEWRCIRHRIERAITAQGNPHQTISNPLKRQSITVSLLNH